MNVNAELFEQFRRFCVPYIHCWDIDPVYPVLNEVQRLRKNTEEQAIWHTLLYVTWYNLGSAEYMLNKYPEPCLIERAPILPTGSERRGFRGSSGTVKAVELLQQFGTLLNAMSLECWVDNACSAGGQTGWERMYDAFIGFKHNGTWAAYKWCDLCKNVLGYNITAPDIGVGGGGEHAGPVPGLVQLTGESWKRCAYDRAFINEFYLYCKARGIPFDGLEEMETGLCDFNSWTHKRYYVGHDIDKQQEDFIKINVPEIYWQARRAVFPAEYLGELNGWSGVRSQLKGGVLC